MITTRVPHFDKGRWPAFPVLMGTARVMTAFFLLLIFILPAKAQEDSLLVVLRNAESDSSKAAILIELCKVAMDTDLKKSEVYAQQAVDVHKRTQNKAGLAAAYRFLGLAQLYGSRYKESVESWQYSLAYYDSVGDRANVARIYSNLGAVYENQSNDVKALEYMLKSQKVAEEIGDTSRLMAALTNIAVIYGKKPHTIKKGIEVSLQALKFADTMNDKEMQSKISTNLGELYFSLGKDTIAIEYFERAAQGYEGAESLVPALLNIGKVYSSRKDFDSAFKYQQQALGIAEKVDSKRDITAALLALAETYQNKGDRKSALSLYERAREIGENIKTPEELKVVYTGLSDIYSTQRDFERAYRYQKLLTTINDTLYNITYAQKLEGQLFAYEIEKKQNQITILNKDKELAEIDLERQKFIKNAFMVGLILIFFIAFIIFRNYRAKVKINKILDRQKDEIENLLLNILPEEVAQELKTDGQATPRSYESVSVLFTDFKGFTTIAETMTPNELVAELNDFFVAFDDIIEKNNLEKIKTIGDAYMCAGGIPTSNMTHPVDIITAGLQIQQYMEDHNVARKEKGLPVWGLRVGVHTGPVTAGVVGRKKYAYDIWGSAVNIASRMESNGEVGKVNISEATYNLVKDKFSCVHRGKISAKNIGEIDMYFVEAMQEVTSGE